MRTSGLVVLGLVLLVGLFPVVSITASSSTSMPSPEDPDAVLHVFAAENLPFDAVVIAPRLRELTPQPIASSKVGIAPTPNPPMLRLPPLPPTLRIDDEVPGAFDVPVTVPIVFWGYGVPIAVLTFSLDYDQSCLSFDATDSDLDGIPDSVSADTLADVGLVSVLFDGADTDGEIDIVVADTAEPIGLLAYGTLVEIHLTPTCNPGPGQGVSVPVDFSTSPAPSFSDSDGQDRFGQAFGGSVRLGTPLATATPTVTPTPTPIPTATPTPTPTATPIPSHTGWGLPWPECWPLCTSGGCDTSP